jgi:iron complex transport system permease protein
MKKYVSFRSEKVPVSFLVDKNTLFLTLVFAILMFLVLVISIGMGTLKIHPIDVLKVLIGMGTERDALFIEKFRLPRALTALLVGASLAVAGAILQGLIQNPLASPDVIGITGGASAAAVAFIVLFESVSITWLPVAAFLGATLITFLIYGLAWKKGVTPLRFVLIGVGIDAAMHALTTLLLVISPTQHAAKAKIWLTGSVYGTNWDDVSTLFIWMLVLFPFTFVYARTINVQQLGDEIATGVGSPVQRHRFFLLLISAGLAGAAIAIGGAMTFVGLLAPHIARKLVGPSFGGLLPITALIGALMVMLADLIARTAFLPLDLPAGIFTSLIGAPFFMYLLYKNRNH